MKCKISVVIPIYNREKYITQCVESIMNQSFKEIEIICVNDGSTDNSLKIIEQLQNKDKRIIIITKENGGVCSARNVGLENSKGDYIIFIDSDDWIEPNCLEDCYNKITKFNLDMVVFNLKTVHSNPKLNRIRKNLVDFTEEDIISGKEYFISFLNGKAFESIWNKLIKKDILIQNNIKFLEGVFSWEDSYFLAKLTKYVNKIGKIDKSFYNYRQGENNNHIGHNKQEKQLKDTITVFSEVEKLYSNEKNIVYLIKKIKVTKMFLIISRDTYFNFKFYKEFEKEFLKTLKKVKFSEKDTVLINKKLIYSLNLIKIFPFHIFIKFLVYSRILYSKLKHQYF